MTALTSLFLWLVAGTILAAMVCIRVRSRRSLRVFFIVFSLVWTAFAAWVAHSHFESKILRRAIEDGDIEGVGAILEGKEIDDSRSFFSGYSPLHVAVEAGHTEIVALLLGAGSDVNAQTSSRATPLHLAARGGNEAIVEQLLQAGADPNANGFRHHDTPLHVASLFAHSDIIRQLLDAGADPQSRNMLGKTPIDIAEEKGSQAVLAAFRSYQQGEDDSQSSRDGLDEDSPP